MAQCQSQCTSSGGNVLSFAGYCDLANPVSISLVDAVTSSGILKAKQKLGVTFNFDKQDVIDFMKFSRMTMYRASEANSEK